MDPALVVAGAIIGGAFAAPADDRLYGVTASGSVVTIDRVTGAATFKSNLATRLPNGVRASLDVKVAAAYSHSVAAAKTRLLFDIDAGTDALYLQLPPKMARKISSASSAGRLANSVSTLSAPVAGAISAGSA